ncbi:MAG: M48 family metalloprotease, partial [Cystobacterineae bacterium]|nr:M48 family metalloprotease [Cystobacterineae bacterium]
MDAFFSAEQWARAQAYAFPHYVWKAASLPFLILVYALLFRWTPSLYAFAQQRCAHPLCLRMGTLPLLRVGPALSKRLWKGPGLGVALLFALSLIFLTASFYVPVDIFLGYVWEHRFGLSAHGPLSFAWDFFKGMLLECTALSCVVVGLLGFARRTQHGWWILGLCSMGALLLAPHADPWRARLYDKQHSLPASQLREHIHALLQQAQVEVHDIWVEENSRATRKLQAYFAGQGPSRTLVLNDNLLQTFNEGEILAAVAHEAAHANESKLWSQLGSCLALLAALGGMHQLMRQAHKRGWLGITHYADVRILPLLFLCISLANLLVRPVSGAYSRARELEADRQAILLTNDPNTFVRMLQKLCIANQADPSPPRWVVLMGMSHPPPMERIQALLPNNHYPTTTDHHHYLPPPLPAATTTCRHHYLPPPLPAATTTCRHHYLPPPQ